MANIVHVRFDGGNLNRCLLYMLIHGQISGVCVRVCVVTVDTWNFGREGGLG